MNRIFKTFKNNTINFLKFLQVKYFYSDALKIEQKNREIFYSKFIKSGDLCFDVGANMGNRTKVFLALGARVVAVEPQEKCYTFLKMYFGDKISLVRKGLDAKVGVKTFYLSNVSVLSSFSDKWINSVKKGRFNMYNWENKVEVEMTTLDNLVIEFGTPSFIKIDVEGFEVEVLNGLSKPVKMISFEYTVPEQLENIELCLQQIEKYNPEVECNYSVGESMNFELENWVSYKDMLSLINTESFSITTFGDIYVKSQSLNFAK